MKEKKTSVLRNEVIEMMGSNELNDNASTVPAIRYCGVEKKVSEANDQIATPKILLNELSMDEYYENGPPAKLSVQSEGNGRKASRLREIIAR